MNSDVSIIPYSPELKSHFYDINKEWISSMFVMEPIDEEVLSNPDKYILNDGGQIWLASHPTVGIVGACALRKTGTSEFELTKMGVLQKARGLKVGEVLLKFVIDYVKENQIQLCYLLTNSKCEAAIHLYLKNGFEHSEEIMQRFGAQYERCDVAMKLT
ncbi:MAG: GNAT family N-acetyltransferase [Bdellovibrionales bacterium]|nr:GNAT family N-acetyltransferase [Bdellovibrionales bacterium]NQZ17960.1 GNAT family N-acetyltransferase [Bdellovibrionales bacterium]